MHYAGCLPFKWTAPGITTVIARYTQLKLRPMLFALTSEQKNVKIYIIDQFEYSHPYSLQQKNNGVTCKNNMEFGIGCETRDWIAIEDEFMPIWLESSQAMARPENTDKSRLSGSTPNCNRKEII